MALVDMHSSWLVINSIVGCTNGCKYCLLQDNGKNLCKPKILGTPKQAIQELVDFKYYDKNLPLCLFPNTDIFLNESNISYLLETLKELEIKMVKNDLILITKCLIPENVIQILKQMQNNGRNIVVYLSYSNLGKDIEPNVNTDDIKANFENLYKYEIPTVHYYRPFIPQNSREDRIKETLSFVHQYTPVSATMGLMYVPNMIGQDPTWDYLKQYDEEVLKKAVSLWPRSAWDYFYNNYNEEQQIFQTNTCALNSVLKRPSLQYYGTYECNQYNHCSEEQRKRCEKSHKEINKQILINKLNLLLNKLKITGDYIYEFDNENGLKIVGLMLDVKTLSYLSYLLGIKVYVDNGIGLNATYNSSLNGAKPFILERKLYE